MKTFLQINHIFYLLISLTKCNQKKNVHVIHVATKYVRNVPIQYAYLTFDFLKINHGKLFYIYGNYFR